jgi:hypothetical protein
MGLILRLFLDASMAPLQETLSVHWLVRWSVRLNIALPQESSHLVGVLLLFLLRFSFKSKDRLQSFIAGPREVVGMRGGCSCVKISAF